MAVASAVLSSQEFRGNMAAEFYRTLLARNPSAAEVQGWASQPLRVTDMRIQFMSSVEFTTITQPVSAIFSPGSEVTVYPPVRAP